MGKRRPHTPRSIIKNALRTLWLRSREHQAALKREHYTCQVCGRKQSKAKGREFSVDVHHASGRINWEPIFEAIYRHLLIHPDGLEVLCPEDHDNIAKEIGTPQVGEHFQEGNHGEGVECLH